MTIASKKIKCPNCNKKIEMTYKPSESYFNFKTDYSCIGACSPTPIYNL